MAKLTKKPCYFCGNVSTSKEHAPPQQFFKGFDCDSITVPACDAHNSNKSSLDQAVISAFLIPLHNGKDTYSLEEDVKLALTESEEAFEYVKRTTYSASVINDPPSKTLPEVSYLEKDIHPWIRQLTAALIWNTLKKRDDTIQWDDVPVWSPEWIYLPLDRRLTVEEFKKIWGKQVIFKAHLEALNWSDGWSAHPKAYPQSIYYFQLYFEKDEVLFKHVFYNRYTWYVVVSPERETIGHLMRKIGLDSNLWDSVI